jgi:class 3 adenylate cyclase
MSESSGKSGGLAEPRADLRAFLIADLRGSTAYAESLGDVAAAELARRFAAYVDDAVADCGGRVIELRGDEAMAAFTSTRGAVRASIAVQERCRGVGGVPLPLGVGVGLDAGEAVVVGDGFRARALNIAARLCSAAAAGEILATETVCRLAGPVEEARYSSIRHLRAKGVAEPLAVRAVEPLRALPPLPATPTPRRSRRRPAIGRRGQTLVALTALALVAFLVIALYRGTTGGGVVLRADSVAVIDPRTGRPIADVSLPALPGGIAAGRRYVWVAEENSGSVVCIDSRTLKSQSVGIGIDPAALAVGLGQAWAYDAVGGRAVEIDPLFRERPTPIKLPPCRAAQCEAGGIAVGQGGIWFGRSYGGAGSASNPGVVWKLDAQLRIAKTIGRVPADRLAVAPHSIWTYGDYGFVSTEVDSHTGQTLQRVPLPRVVAEYNQPGMTYAFGNAWLVAPTSNPPALFEIAPKATGGLVQRTITIPASSYDITHDNRWLWITTEAGAIVKVDPYTRRVVKTYQLGHAAYGIGVADGDVWVALEKGTSH